MNIEPEQIDPLKLKEIESYIHNHTGNYFSSLFKKDIIALLAHIKYLEIPNYLENKDFETSDKKWSTCKVDKKV